MKKTLAIFLSAVTLLCTTPLAGGTVINLPGIHRSGLFALSSHAADIVNSGNCGIVDEANGLDGSQVTWTLDSDSLLTIDGSGEMNNYDWSRSPWSTNTDIKTIVIQDGVTNIGNFAFHDCTGLTLVIIPNTVTSIGRNAFNGCTGLTSVIIPNSVISIGENAFGSCTGLTSVTIPDSVTSIGHFAFFYCTELMTLTVDANNPVYESTGNCVIEKTSKTLIAGCNNSVIPNDGSVTSIGNDAFSACTGLTSITIPDSVMSIGEWAFSACTGLTSVTIPNSVMSIGEGAFSACTGLTSVTIPNSMMSIGEGAFFNCKELTSVSIPDSVTNIRDETFRGCEGLTEVIIPDNVKEIDYAAFGGCSSLHDVYYTGKEEQWNAIRIGEVNESLLNATIHFSYTSIEDQDQNGREICAYCGTTHPNTFMGKITNFFHSFLYFFAHLFGKI